MKLFYCGYNGFDQVKGKIGKGKVHYEHLEKKCDVCNPIPIFESEPNTSLEVFLGWSRLIIVTIDDSFVRGYWNGVTGYEGSISKGNPFKQITCTENLAVGIDQHGKLKKLPLADLSTRIDWEDILSQGCNGNQEEVGSAKFVKVSSSEHSVIALDESGNIHLPPLRMENMQSRFVDIACGKEHFIAVTSDGIVFTWGSGSRGQLGHGTVESIDLPQQVEVLGGIRIVQIAAGGWHSCALSESGDVYVWGWNESGQLGLPCRNLSGSARTSDEYVSIQSEPRLLDGAMPFSVGDDVNVTSIGCGARHTAMTLGDKSGWSWGWNGCGQLGTGDRRSHDTPVCVIQDVEKVMCGAWSTAWLSNL